MFIKFFIFLIASIPCLYGQEPAKYLFKKPLDLCINTDPDFLESFIDNRKNSKIESTASFMMKVMAVLRESEEDIPAPKIKKLYVANFLNHENMINLQYTPALQPLISQNKSLVATECDKAIMQNGFFVFCDEGIDEGFICSTLSDPKPTRGFFIYRFLKEQLCYQRHTQRINSKQLNQDTIFEDPDFPAAPTKSKLFQNFFVDQLLQINEYSRSILKHKIDVFFLRNIRTVVIHQLIKALDVDPGHYVDASLKSFRLNLETALRNKEDYAIQHCVSAIDALQNQNLVTLTTLFQTKFALDCP